MNTNKRFLKIVFLVVLCIKLLLIYFAYQKAGGQNIIGELAKFFVIILLMSWAFVINSKVPLYILKVIFVFEAVFTIGTFSGNIYGYIIAIISMIVALSIHFHEDLEKKFFPIKNMYKENIYKEKVKKN